MLDRQPKANTSSTCVPILSKFRIVVPSAIMEMNSQKTVRELGHNYCPSDCDIFCGRGKGFYNRPGNKKFRTLVSAHMSKYLTARSKVDKSAVLNTIIDEVRSTSDAATGRPAQFIKFTKPTGWVEIGDDQAREKVGHAMREAISSSSSDTVTTTKPRALKQSRPSSPTPLSACSSYAFPTTMKESVEDDGVEPFLNHEHLNLPLTDSALLSPWSSGRSSFARNSLSSDMMRAAIESFIGV